MIRDQGQRHALVQPFRRGRSWTTFIDINGFHVTDAHVFEALEAVRAGPLELGSVGGGTGMI